MKQEFRYQRPTEHLEFYAMGYRPVGPLPPDVQPQAEHDYQPINLETQLDFAEGEMDIRRFLVNTPEGDTLGTIDGLLADYAQSTLPYAYVKMNAGRIVVVPIDQLTIFPDYCRVTLDGGLEALSGAPEAKYSADDVGRAEVYWRRYREDQAA